MTATVSSRHGKARSASTSKGVGTREPGYRPVAWKAGVAVGGVWVAWPRVPCRAARCFIRDPASSTLFRTGRAAGGLLIRDLEVRAWFAAALFSSSLSTALAQTLVVTGVREPLAIDRLAGDVWVIDSDTLRSSTADSLADVLRREAGLQLSRSGGPGQSSGLFIRGANAGQTVVLVDGVRIGSATLGFAALEGLSLSQVERIEVLRGPGSSLYGADAIGGVVQIFTRRGQPGLQVQAQADIGGYGSRDAMLSLLGGGGAWDGALTLSHEQSAGTSTLRPNDQFGNYNPDRDGYRLGSAQAKVGFTPVAGQRIGLTLLRTKQNTQYDGSEFLPPTYNADNTPDFRTRVETTLSALDWGGALGAGLKGSARLAQSSDDAENGGQAVDRYHTSRRQLSAQLAWQAGVIGQLVGAVEHQRESASSSSYVADVARNNTAIVLALTGHRDALSWQADLRHDKGSDYGGVSTARLGGAYTLAPGWRLRVLAGSTFRSASFNDLYFPGYGVTTLQPEHGRSIEVGLNWKGTDAQASVTAFSNRVRDLIGYEGDRSFCPSDPSYDFGCARNVNRARLSGATLAGQKRLGAWLLKSQIDFLDAHDEATGARLSRRAAHQATLSAEWKQGPWSAGASMLNLGARPDAGKTLAAQTTVDLRAAWQFSPAWTLQAKLLNATDRDTEPARDYQAWAGRPGSACATRAGRETCAALVALVAVCAGAASASADRARRPRRQRALRRATAAHRLPAAFTDRNRLCARCLQPPCRHRQLLRLAGERESAAQAGRAGPGAGRARRRAEARRRAGQSHTARAGAAGSAGPEGAGDRFRQPRRRQTIGHAGGPDARPA